MTDADLDNIESAAQGKMCRTPYAFAHPADTLKLVAEVRRLRALILKGTANELYAEGEWIKSQTPPLTKEKP